MLLVPGAILFAIALQASASATHQIYSRTTSDDCASLANAPLKVPVFLGSSVTIGLINTCLCVSGIPEFVNNNVVAIAAAAVSSTSATEAALVSLISDASSHRTCQYPDQASQICTASNVCDFSCQNGFTPSPPALPTSCVCQAPMKLCNGVCAAACPSSNPRKRQLDLQDRRNLCGTGLTACGVYGFDSMDAWECINTKSDLESCGGCTVPLGRSRATGTDCTAIPGVLDVACISGSCSVQRCQSGLVVASDGSSCTPPNPFSVEGEVLAAVYGLEHVPLKKKATD